MAFRVGRRIYAGRALNFLGQSNVTLSSNTLLFEFLAWLLKIPALLTLHIK